MNKMLKVMAISVITVLFLALPLMAQVGENGLTVTGDPVSNQRGATATLYKNDVDNYLSVNNYSTVELNKWFGFLHWNGNGGHLGFATNVGPLYLGLRYNGKIFEENSVEGQILIPGYDPTTQELSSLTEYNVTGVYTEGWEEDHTIGRWQNSLNQLDILIGIANQGIKVGFYENMSVNANKEGNHILISDGGFDIYGTGKIDEKNGYITYYNEADEFSQLSGWMQPSLKWGTVLSVGGLTIKPRAGAAFGIYQNILIDNYIDEYTTYYGAVIGEKEITREGYNNGILRPEFTVGADIGLPKKDTLATTITVDYTLNFDIYSNDYSASGFSGTAAGPVSWDSSVETTKSINGEKKETKATLDFNDATAFRHRIAPRLTLDNAVAEGLNVGLAVVAPVTITVGSNDKYSETKTYTETITYVPVNNAQSKVVTDETVYIPEGLTETTMFYIAPAVKLGAKYALIPGRFSVNAGVSLDPFTYRYTKTNTSLNGSGTQTTSKTTDGDGVVTEEVKNTEIADNLAETSAVYNEWSYFTGSVGGGFVFNFNEKAALDLWANSGNLSPTWDVNLATVNVMVILKF